MARKGFVRHAKMCIKTVRAHWDQTELMHAASVTPSQEPNVWGYLREGRKRLPVMKRTPSTERKKRSQKQWDILEQYASFGIW